MSDLVRLSYSQTEKPLHFTWWLFCFFFGKEGVDGQLRFFIILVSKIRLWRKITDVKNPSFLTQRLCPKENL